MGTYELHWQSTDPRDSYRLLILRHEEGRVYCVAALDTLSNPHAERDAELLLRGLEGRA